MFVRRSRYDHVARECEQQVNEIEGLRIELKNKLKENEKLRNDRDELYKQARLDADAKSRMSIELKGLIEYKNKYDELRNDMRYLTKNDLREYMTPEPEDSEDRALFVSRVSGWFNGGLRDQINYMISGFKSEVARFPLSERETDFFRSAVNVCYLLNEWGDNMIKEHYANVKEQGGNETEDAFDIQSDEENEESVEKIKKAVNE